MRAAFGVEVIGLSLTDSLTARKIGIERELTRRSRPTLVEITSEGRRLVQRQVDYRGMNRAGTRGMWWWWTLESGRVYEARYRTGWRLDSWRCRYLTVTEDGDIVDLTEEEVRQWLSASSGSTS